MFIEDLERGRRLIATLTLTCWGFLVMGQPLPAVGENIDFISTFGPEAETQWGDDDQTQIFFFIIPKTCTTPVYLRIFDPGCGGKYDLATDGAFNTRTSFSVYGGAGAFSDPDARRHEVTGNYKSGTLLVSLTFSDQEELDDDWFSMGPFNPGEGEFQKQFEGYILKVIIEGVEGNDGNLYRLFLSQDPDKNVPVGGSNAFTYKYSFRLKNEPGQVTHLYPLIGENVRSIKQFNFDFDNEGEIKIYSVKKNGHQIKLSGDDELATSQHEILPKERGKSMDIQIVKSKNRINDMTFYMLNQYDQAIPFYAIPIGGVPKYLFKVQVTYDYENQKRSY